MEDPVNTELLVTRHGYGIGPSAKVERNSPLRPAMLPIPDLIQLIHKYPNLWDRSCSGYKNKYEKEKSWRAIYKEVEPSYDELKPALKQEIGAQITKKWYNVRDSYRKFKKHGGGKRAKPYVYSEILSFLDPIYANIEDKDITMTADASEDDVLSNFDENEIYLDMEEADVGPSIKRTRINDGTSKEETDENIVAILANLIQKEEDEDRAFFKSITPSVKNLSEESRFEFRIQVMNLIRNLKKKDNDPVNVKIERVSDSESD